MIRLPRITGIVLAWALVSPGWLAAEPADDLVCWLTSQRELAEQALFGPPGEQAAARTALLAPGDPPAADWPDLSFVTSAAASGDRQDLVRAWDRLKALETATQPAGPGPTPAAVRALTTAILSDERYQPAPGITWLEPWLPAIERFVDWLFAPWTRRQQQDQPGQPLLASLLTGAALLGLVGLTVRWRRQRDQGSTPDRAAPAVDGRTLEPAPAAATLRQQATVAAAEGDLAAALSLLHLAVLRRLDETGRLVLDASCTDWENVARLAGHREAACLGLLAEATERVVHGKQALSEREYAACVVAANQIWHEQGNDDGDGEDAR